MAAARPVCSANLAAASTLGPIDPPAKVRARSWSAVARRIGRGASPGPRRPASVAWRRRGRAVRCAAPARAGSRSCPRSPRPVHPAGTARLRRTRRPAGRAGRPAGRSRVSRRGARARQAGRAPSSHVRRCPAASRRRSAHRGAAARCRRARPRSGAGSSERVAFDRAGHAARPSAAAPQLGAGDRDDLDARVPQASVGVDVALVGHDDAGRDREHVVAVVPLLALGLVAVAAGLEDPQARQLERVGDGLDGVRLLLDRQSPPTGG
jgi:hypothetical protein